MKKLIIFLFILTVLQACITVKDIAPKTHSSIDVMHKPEQQVRFTSIPRYKY